VNDGKNIRVLIAGDRIASRSGFKALLATELEIEMVAEAADGCQALRLVEELQPDVVLMDARMPVMDGLETPRIESTASWSPAIQPSVRLSSEVTSSAERFRSIT